MTSIVVIGSHLHTVAATIASYIDRVWGGGVLEGGLRLPPFLPSFEGEFFCTNI